MPVPPVIKKIAPIRNLGVFKDCQLADAPELLKYNLIYGFNGSGKTTLSRVLASLEAGAVRSELPQGGTFDVHLTDGTTIRSNGDLTTLRGRMLVFNTDFIDESFRWKEGTAKPVFYLGREQAASADQLSKTSTALTSAEAALRAAEELKLAIEKQFTNQKRDAARLIAEQLNLGRLYDASNLVADYQKRKYDASEVLNEEERLRLKGVLTQLAPLAKRSLLAKPDLNLATVVGSVRDLGASTLGAMALADLQGHEAMRGWLAHGVKYHVQHSLKSCLLCANHLTEDRIRTLASVVGANFDAVQASIDACSMEVIRTQDRCQSIAFAMPSNNDVSQAIRTQFESAAKAVRDGLKRAEEIAAQAALVLADKKKAPHSAVDIEALADSRDCAQLEILLEEKVAELNKLIEKHNAEFDAFDQAKAEAHARVRHHYLADGQDKYLSAKSESEQTARKVVELTEQVGALKLEQERLRQEVRKHGPAAAIINKLIHNYLGRKEIALVTRDDGYQLNRSGLPVRGPLSEGEKTAIALCYFLSTVEAEGRRRKDLIVVIDDPVSSLDTQALNYAFSIVRSALADAGQLLLLTHNLNFMNEAKKWLKPKTEREAEKRGEPGTGTASLLFLDAIQVGGMETRSASIKDMPKYIREYESEYHYLFHLVLKFVDGARDNEGYFFIIPNALRKLAETFLAFKLPGSEGLANKMEKVAQMEHELDPARIRSLDRLAQTESHGDNLEDLISFSSMTVEEAKDAATTLLVLMEALDKEHVKHMKSICG